MARQKYRDVIVAEFSRKRGGFPGNVGTIDGFHIPVKVPGQDALLYINRKGCRSVPFQRHVTTRYCSLMSMQDGLVACMIQEYLDNPV